MDDASRTQVEEAVSRHLRASGEPVREAFLYERVRGDGIDVSGEAFIGVLLTLRRVRQLQGLVYGLERLI
jgi:hypothetical protein